MHARHTQHVAANPCTMDFESFQQKVDEINTARLEIIWAEEVIAALEYRIKEKREEIKERSAAVRAMEVDLTSAGLHLVRIFTFLYIGTMETYAFSMYTRQPTCNAGSSWALERVAFNSATVVMADVGDSRRAEIFAILNKKTPDEVDERLQAAVSKCNTAAWKSTVVAVKDGESPILKLIFETQDKAASFIERMDALVTSLNVDRRSISFVHKQMEMQAFMPNGIFVWSNSPDCDRLVENRVKECLALIKDSKPALPAASDNDL